jgi:hypothetical protein
MTSRNLCGLGVSPALAITNTPKSTARYRVQIVNIDVLFQRPWQTTIPASTNSFPEGALAGYEGPCVGELRQYQVSGVYYRTYRLEVLAVDDTNKPLAYGATTFPVYSIDHTRNEERRTVSKPSQSAPRVTPEAPEPPRDYPTPPVVPLIPVPGYEPL